MSKSKKASLEDMSREAQRRQDNLAADIDELIDRINPRNALMRWKNEALDAAKGFSAAGDGQDARGRIAAVAGGVIGVIALAAGVTALVLARGREEDGADAGGASAAKRSNAAPPAGKKPAKAAATR